MKKLILAAILLSGCGGDTASTVTPEPITPEPVVNQLTLAFQSGDLNNDGGRVMTTRVIVYTSGLDAQEFTESSASGEFDNELLINGSTTYDLWVNESFVRSGVISFDGEDSFCLLTWYLPSTYDVAEIYHDKNTYCN